MGAGKSTVARVFEELGAARIDADEIGKDLLREPEIKQAIKATFGTAVTDTRGRIDTVKLGRVAFRSREAALKLSGITRDTLIERIRTKIKELRQSGKMVVVDAALLPEWESRDWIDVLIVVDAGEAESVERSCTSLRFKPSNVRARMKHQFSRRRKAGCADIIIPNFGSLENLKERAKSIFWTLVGISGKE
jgi:dephospho-CoA kinase